MLSNECYQKCLDRNRQLKTDGRGLKYIYGSKASSMPSLHYQTHHCCPNCLPNILKIPVRMYLASWNLLNSCSIRTIDIHKKNETYNHCSRFLKHDQPKHMFNRGTKVTKQNMEGQTMSDRKA